MFSFTKVASFILATDIVTEIGLQQAVQRAGVLMMIGCWFRSGIPMIPGKAHSMTYPFVVPGTILVGFAQPTERATSTAWTTHSAICQISVALAAFVCSTSITNNVGAFIDDVMVRGGITSQFEIDLAGASFELTILVGGILIGGYVDRTKQYRRITQICLGATALLVIPLGLTEHAIGKEPIMLLLSLLGLGIAAGPVQPINAELAVDVTYPGDETAVKSVQQIGGNPVSALLVPVAELAPQRDYQLLPKIKWAASDIRGDAVLLMTIAVLTILYFTTFDAPLRRTMAVESDDDK